MYWCTEQMIIMEENMLEGGDMIVGLYNLPEFIMLFMFLVSAKGKNKDVTKYIRQDLEKLLRTPEEAAQFDEEMFAEPLFRMVTDRNGSTLSFTEHYIYSEMFLFGVNVQIDQGMMMYHL